MNSANFLKRGLSITKSFLWRVLIGKSGKYLTKPAKLFGIATLALKKIDTSKGVKEITKEVIAQIKLAIEMIRAWASGSYTGITKQKMALLVAAVLYFILPIDLIPDMLPVIGFLDDVSIVMWVWNTLAKEIAAFTTWKEQQSAAFRKTLALGPELTYKELYELAKREELPGRSKMKKDELLKALNNLN